MHDSGLLDMMALCSNLGVPRPTAQNFIDILEATHLIYRLRPFSYGKEVSRARYKIYLADAAIAPAVLMKKVFWMIQRLLESLLKQQYINTLLPNIINSKMLNLLIGRVAHQNLYCQT
jgi:predicted AAA+ superfamily ATPase